MEIKAETIAFIGIIGTLAGVLVTGLFGLIISIIGKRAEERKQQRDLIFNIALEHWKRSHEFATKYGGIVEPFVFSVYQVLVFYEKILNKNLSQTELEKAFKEYSETTEKVNAYIKQIMKL